MTEQRQNKEVTVRAIAHDGSHVVRVGDGTMLFLSSDGAATSVQPEDLFVGGLVACASLGLERSLGARGFDFENLDAQVTRTPDGRRCVTVHAVLQPGFPAGEQSLLKREILLLCRRYAPACDLEMDLVLEAANAEARTVELVGAGANSVPA